MTSARLPDWPDVVDLAVLTLLAIWFVVSVAIQLRPSALPTLRRWDRASLIPQWRFFAPIPATGDFHLLYRDALADGTVTRWYEVRLGEARRWSHAFWNPGRRARKALFDIVGWLGQELPAPPNAILISFPYLVLLAFIVGLPRSAASRQRQFVILESHGSLAAEAPIVLFTSAMHRLD